MKRFLDWLTQKERTVPVQFPIDYDMPQYLPWSRWPWDRCRAVKEPNDSGFWGRCELKKRHKGDHALDRGMDIPTFTTKWTTNGS